MPEKRDVFPEKRDEEVLNQSIPDERGKIISLQGHTSYSLANSTWSVHNMCT